VVEGIQSLPRLTGADEQMEFRSALGTAHKKRTFRVPGFLLAGKATATPRTATPSEKPKTKRCQDAADTFRNFAVNDASDIPVSYSGKKKKKKSAGKTMHKNVETRPPSPDPDPEGA